MFSNLSFTHLDITEFCLSLKYKYRTALKCLQMKRKISEAKEIKKAS